MATPGWQAEHGLYRTANQYGSASTGPRAPPALMAVGGACRPGTRLCFVPGGVWFCADFNTDPFNCGGCCKPCDPGEICCRGSCKPPQRCDIPSPPIPPAITGGCPGGFERCQTPSGCRFCTDTNRDRLHCGGCDMPCRRLNQVCCDGDCVVANTDEVCGSGCSGCGAGERCCLDPTPLTTHRCVALGTSKHCLDCGDTCLETETCCPDGCANLDTDVDHCGSCDEYCPPIAPGTPPEIERATCRSGDCVCRTGFRLCGRVCCSDGLPCCGGDICCPASHQCCPDGRCVELGTQLHCSGCDDACADDERCCGGTCLPVTSPARCGECDRACGPDQACCRKGSVTLDGETVQNWACTTLGTATDCTACGDACPPPKVCQGGACTCPPGREPCGTTCCPSGQDCCDDACVDVQTSEEHCGACNDPCIPGQVCDTLTGVCSPYTPVCQQGDCVCPSGHYNCHGWCSVNSFSVCCPPGTRYNGPHSCAPGTRCCSTGSGCCL